MLSGAAPPASRAAFQPSLNQGEPGVTKVIYMNGLTAVLPIAQYRNNGRALTHLASGKLGDAVWELKRGP